MGASKDPERARRRTRLIVAAVLGLVVLLTAVQVLIRQLQAPTPIAANVLIFALVNVNIVLLLLLVLLVFRHVFKVYLERRENILGAKFRVKLVVAFVSLALLPASLLFLVASNLITTSIETWFNIQVEGSLQRAQEVVQATARGSEERALAIARGLAGRVAAEGLLAPGQETALRGLMAERFREHGLAALQVFGAGGVERVRLVGGEAAEGAALGPRADSLKRGYRGEAYAQTVPLAGGEVVRAVAPVPVRGTQGIVVVATLTPAPIAAKAAEIRAALRDYQQLKLLKNPIKGIYLMLFLMVTLVIIFAALWVGVRLARGITVPIQRLAEGTRAVAAGDLTYKVNVRADDEIGILVDSFNRMTGDLHRSRAEAEERRAYMEAVLENIAAGVLSLDREGRVNTINQAAVRILGLDGQPVLGRPYAEALAGEALTPIRLLCRRMIAQGRATADQQVALGLRGRVATLVANVSPLRDREGGYAGLVMVLDDITELLRAQQAMAWREVARRVAHEIKNPLTPIQLSVQRLRKKFAEAAPDRERVLEESTRTIIQEVDALKGLVDEFSRHARMPASQPRPGPLAPLLAEVVRLYSGVGRPVKIGMEADPDLPPVNLDPAQMKRALVNLVDNALEAIDGDGEIRLLAYPAPAPAPARVRVEVVDNGRGIPPEDRERLFLPDFSTKAGGTGLGLAIVHRIVAEHGGHIRAEENLPRGTRIAIELPVVPEVPETEARSRDPEIL